MKLLTERCQILMVPDYLPGNPYSVLGLDKSCTKRQILKAFRSVAKKYHPDLLPHDLPPERVKSCEYYFTEALQAKELLLDENRREVYDKYGLTGGQLFNHANMLNAAKELLSDFFDKICQTANERQIRKSDIIKVIVGMIAKEKEGLKKETESIAEYIAQYKLIISRTHSDTESFLTKKAKFNLERAGVSQKNKLGNIMAADKAVELIKEYQYDFDKAEEPVLFGGLSQTSMGSFTVKDFRRFPGPGP